MYKIISDILLLLLLLYFIYITHIGKWSSEAYTVVHNCSNSSKGVAQAQIEGRIQSNIYANIYFIIQNYGVSSYYSIFENLFADVFGAQIN